LAPPQQPKSPKRLPPNPAPGAPGFRTRRAPVPSYAHINARGGPVPTVAAQPRPAPSPHRYLRARPAGGQKPRTARCRPREPIYPDRLFGSAPAPGEARGTAPERNHDAPRQVQPPGVDTVHVLRRDLRPHGGQGDAADEGGHRGPDEHAAAALHAERLHAPAGFGQKRRQARDPVPRAAAGCGRRRRRRRRARAGRGPRGVTPLLPHRGGCARTQ
ncbi:hypothetical protein DFJ74DRAFT_758898, partial [Hyaloraphidium curvatum]